MTLRIAVLLSGSGRTLANLLDQADRGLLDAKVALVISSSRKAYGLVRAREREIPTQVHRWKRGADAAAYSEGVFAACRGAQVDLVCLAGWLKLLRPIPPEFAGRVLNIHPALLPAYGGKGFYGHHVHQAVLDAGEAVSGCTVHQVDDEYDHGPIVLQHEVPVEPGDDVDALAARVFAAECAAYPEAIRQVGARLLAGP
ncbi:phosphoribosylglycinamide formyltransferase [Planctomycetota bacterium]|nr:phosphoribosylglycinamide formyltransferase [Planctomycetota bacterium]